MKSDCLLNHTEWMGYFMARYFHYMRPKLGPRVTRQGDDISSSKCCGAPLRLLPFGYRCSDCGRSIRV